MMPPRSKLITPVSVGLFILLYTSCCYAAVLPGIDVLAGQKFHLLQSKRVGLITNHTGRSASAGSRTR